MTVKTYTWQEVAAHNCEETGVWVSLDDTVYDITPFLNSHPGGKEFLLLSAGRDITDLFRSYHPFSDKPMKVLAGYAIGKVATRQYPRFKPDSGLYAALCKRVGEYFHENKIHHKEPFGAIWRMSLMMVIYITAYLGIFTPYFDSFVFDVHTTEPSMMFNISWWVQRIIFSTILGWAQMMFLLHIMHDSSHSAFGPNETWWKWGGRMFSETFIGSNMTCWQNQHVVGHHIYTSLYSIDPDVPVVPDNDIRLVVPQQRNAWIYKYQHIYLLFLYCLLAFKNRVQDFTIFLSRKNGPIDVNPITPVEWARLIVSKIIHIIVRVLIPLYYLTFKQWAITYVIAEMVGGGYLAFNFQVSHVSHYAQTPVAKAIPASQSFPVNTQVKSDSDVIAYDVQKTVFDEDRLESDKHCRSLVGVAEATQEELIWDLEWAHLQIMTSVDYSYHSPLCTFMAGALNYQTIHHLFPSVSQYHYPAIAPIVKQVCEEYGVKMNYVDSTLEAFMGHIRYLKMMGEKGIVISPTIPDME